MAELIDAFGEYKEFYRDLYFTVCFDRIASTLRFDTPLKENKENMEAVLEAIDFQSSEFEVVYKEWCLENAKNEDLAKDYPYQYLLKSNSKKLVVWLSLHSEELSVEYLYDCADLELEQWAISDICRLRTIFGRNKSPVFYVLSRNGNGFYTKEVITEKFESDIEKMYNDDFVEVNGIIEECLSLEKAGLILLHGTSGTGKTSYIKHLINRHADKSFIFIQNEFVNSLLQPDFISFLLRHQNSILIIEDAEKVLTSREHVNENSVVSTILQLTDGLFSDYLNIKIICTFNTSMDKIDKALLRKGRMIAYYEFRPLNSAKANELLNSTNHESTHEDMTLADIFNYRNKHFNQAKPGKIGF
ncbi:AAA family ATPase [Pleomorphovibrio marinus]|uniref:AAA family ATPase n=1 Tax=Pleomorphovibrio marinus TaxID=2164132 RepID=UPI000E0AEF62|nr:AAA family ATPase [Pleomorphovibrio marinus]